MHLADVERLRGIRSFPSLVKYLRDDLGWPVESDDFEELTYEYDPSELGLDAKVAVKIKDIKQLRPLTNHQPFGIFFVNFDPKRLPVVVLRRILGALVIRKRTSAEKAKQAVWAMNDLLFISSYGEAQERAISFAYFREDEYEPSDLPTLQVLGWDGRDTVLHLDHAHQTLKQKLQWPENEQDVQGWRQQWASAFTLRHKEVITTSQVLAVRLAELARDIRSRVNAVLEVESDRGPIRKLHAAFKEALIHDLSEDDFADMYAQTVAYGLLSARASRPAGLVQDNLVDMVPVTNPFLQELLQTFLHIGGRKRRNGKALDFDELGVTEVVEVLRNANMEAVLRDFGDRNPQEDPVIHFYEDFLKEYDRKKRTSRGVFYTPKPVVSFIVRSVHELLQTEFSLDDGLADTTTWGEMIEKHPEMSLPADTKSSDPFVTILDPATGTATFLVEVIEVIYATLRDKWWAQGKTVQLIRELWNDYVPKHLLPRLYGYELMMAPYAIAHMKIGLILQATGYQFKSSERVRIFLTNSLEPTQEFLDRFEFDVPALAHEAKAVNSVKRSRRFTVVIGNPPYSTSMSEPEWLMEIMGEWKQGLKETKSDLNREEWKFLRFAQHVCSCSGLGVVGYVINRDFLDGVTKRRMREHLGKIFPLSVIVDLNGDVKGNIPDENVFEIEQGVAIALLCTTSDRPYVQYTSRVGTRKQKYDDLLARVPINSSLVNVEPTAPYFRWVPFSNEHIVQASAEYFNWPTIKSIFNLASSGIQTKRDAVCVAFSAKEMWLRVQRFNSLCTEAVVSEFEIAEEAGDWTVSAAKADIKESGPLEKFITPILYRPFDRRFTYWTGRTKGFHARPRREVMQHVIGHENIGIIFNRQIVGESVSHFGVARSPICHGTFYLGNKGQDYFAPLWIYREDVLSGQECVQPNFTDRFIRALKNNVGPNISILTAYDILHYIYGVFYSPTYRSRYQELIKLDFPRFPLTRDFELFQKVAQRGGELAALHLMESEILKQHITVYIGNPQSTIEKVSYVRKTVWFDKALTTGFQCVPEEVWNFRIGGYQVCEKWLKDRKGRTLSKEDIDHYQKIVVALNETIRIMKEIDEVIEQHGGWPGAFVTEPLEPVESAPSGETDELPFA